MSSTVQPDWEIQLCSSVVPQLYFDSEPEGHGERCAFGVLGVNSHPRTYQGVVIPLDSRHRCVVESFYCSNCYEYPDSCHCQDEDCMGCTCCNILMTLEEFQIHKHDMMQSESNYESELHKKMDDS
jgi:hypothetical protein